MQRFTIHYTFIENGRTCHTSWTAQARSKKDAIEAGWDWFGFDQDNIKVTDVTVECDGDNELTED